MWKASSSKTVFKRTIKFGFATKDEKDVVQQIKVTQFPTVIMQRGSKAEIKEQYKGKMTFTGLQEWINLYSESGMGVSSSAAGGKEESIEEAKPWLLSEILELTTKSQGDICLKGQRAQNPETGGLAKLSHECKATHFHSSVGGTS